MFLSFQLISASRSVGEKKSVANPINEPTESASVCA